MTQPTSGWRRAGLSTLATVALVLGACAAGAGSASADLTFNFDRVAGQNRYLTSVEASKVFGVSTIAILASGEKNHYPDALTANYLAGAKKSPILLTKRTSTPQPVLDRLKASGVKNVFIIGNGKAISAGQEANLESAGYTVRRLGGHSRYDTAKAVIGAVPGSHTTGILARGDNFPDALGGGPLAYAQAFPLAITRPDRVPPQTLAALKGARVKQVIVLGGTTAVSAKVVATLKANDITVKHRADGANRVDTAVKLATYELATYKFSDTRVNVASGEDALGGVDALSGGPVSGKENRPLLITKTKDVPGDELIAYLKDHAATLTGTDNHIFGGTLAVSQSAEVQMRLAAALPGTGTGTATPAPTNVKATLTNADGGTTANDVLITFTPGTETPSGTTYAVQRFAVAPSGLDTCPVASSTNTLPIGLDVTDTNHTDTTATDNNVLLCSAYKVTATAPGGTGGASGFSNTVFVALLPTL